MNKRIISIILCLCLLLSAAGCATEQVAEPIVILYENDVHCEVAGYSKLLAMKNELAESYKHVGVVSSGDFVQGGTLGAVSKGEYIINIMNQVGYDAIALGNHEFDYKLTRLVDLHEMSRTPFVCCNFGETGKRDPYFAPYRIVEYGEIEVAYIGITTPETIGSSNPAQFKNAAGELVYTFHEKDLYARVQKNINAARRKGADIVIALSHVGYSEEGEWSDITDVIENTKGLDAVLDAHSHSVIEEMRVKDKEGEEVLLTSTGTKFEHIGKLTITKDGLDSELIQTETYEKTDPTLDAYLKEIEADYTKLGDRKIGETKVMLNTEDKEGNRLIRTEETNLGNLCADSLRIMTGADVAYVNGGGIRAPIETGEISFNDIYSVFPFGNQVVTAEITGQTLVDMLEMGLLNYPDEDGSFPHTSGITFSVDTSLDSAVQTDENGFFIKVDGKYRVHDVKILDKDSGAYRPVDPAGKYVLAGFNYYLLDLGGGMTMLKDVKILDAEGTLDVELLENYIVDRLGGVVGEEYATVDRRITFK